MLDAWWTEKELERMRRERKAPVQVPLELPLGEPPAEPEASPDPDAAPRGVVVIEF